MFSMANANTPAENKAQGEKFLADNAKNADRKSVV